MQISISKLVNQKRRKNLTENWKLKRSEFMGFVCYHFQSSEQQVAALLYSHTGTDTPNDFSS